MYKMYIDLNAPHTPHTHPTYFLHIPSTNLYSHVTSIIICTSTNPISSSTFHNSYFYYSLLSCHHHPSLFTSLTFTTQMIPPTYYSRLHYPLLTSTIYTHYLLLTTSTFTIHTLTNHCSCVPHTFY